MKKVLCTAFILGTLLLESGTYAQKDRQQPLPTSSLAQCSGFWVFHPFMTVLTSCRARSHGLEPPIKQEIVAWTQDTLNSDFGASCGTGNSSFNEGGKLTKRLSETWENIDGNSLRGRAVAQLAPSRWRIECLLTVWHTPLFVEKVSQACPSVDDTSRVDTSKFTIAIEKLNMKDYEGRALSCTTCDQLLVETGAQRKQKLNCLISTLKCPNKHVDFNDSSCNSDYDWRVALENEPDIIAVRGFLSVSHATLNLHRFLDDYDKELSPAEHEAAHGVLSSYRQKLPLILKVFELHNPDYYNYRAALIEAAAVIARIY